MSVATQTPAVRRSALARLTITELRLYLREPMLVFWGFAFPLLLLIILVSRERSIRRGCSCSAVPSWST